MNRVDQIRFITELAENLSRDVVQQILAERVPEEWDGHELRAYLAQLACRATSGIVQVDGVVKGRRFYRARVYLGECLKRGLP